MATAFEQQDVASAEQYRAELLRQRARDERMRKQQEKLRTRRDAGAARSAQAAAGGRGSERVRIPMVEIALMLGVAIIVDVIQFVAGILATVPLIGWLLGPVGFVIGWTLGIFMSLIVFLWLMMKGVSFSKQGGKGIVGWFGISFLVEFIAGFVPTWTGFMIGLLIREEMQDK